MVPIESEESDLELVGKLRLDNDGSQEITGAEATFILDQLNRCEVSGEAVFDGGVYRIVLLVPGATTVHTMHHADRGRAYELPAICDAQH